MKTRAVAQIFGPTVIMLPLVMLLCAGSRTVILDRIPSSSVAHNPDASSPIRAQGFRNVQELGPDSRTRHLFATQHGPSGFPDELLRSNDELNAVAQDAAGSWHVADQQSLLEGLLGDVRAVAFAPDGHLYFSVTNRDGRGSTRPGDDKTLRVVGKRRPDAGAAFVR